MGAMTNHPSYKHFTNTALLDAFEHLGGMAFDSAAPYAEIERRGLLNLDLLSKRILFSHREALRLHYDPTTHVPVDSEAYLHAVETAIDTYGPDGENPLHENLESLTYKAGYARLLFLKGDALSELRLYPEAMAAFEESISIDSSSDNEAVDRLAYLYLALGKKDKLDQLALSFPTNLAPLFAAAIYEDIDTENHQALVDAIFPRNAYFLYFLLGFLRPIHDLEISLLGRKERSYLPSVEEAAYQFYALRLSFPFFEEALASLREKGKSLLPGGEITFYAAAAILSFSVFFDPEGKKRLTRDRVIREMAPAKGTSGVVIKLNGGEGVKLGKEEIASSLDGLVRSRVLGMTPSGVLRYTAAADFLMGALLPREIQDLLNSERRGELGNPVPPANKA